jgi:hypothetical protein
MKNCELRPLLFGALVEASKTLQRLFEGASHGDIKAYQGALHAVAHTGRRAQVAAINLANQSQQLVGERLDLTFGQRTVHAPTIRRARDAVGKVWGFFLFATACSRRFDEDVISRHQVIATGVFGAAHCCKEVLKDEIF